MGFANTRRSTVMRVAKGFVCAWVSRALLCEGTHCEGKGQKRGQNHVIKPIPLSERGLGAHSRWPEVVFAAAAAAPSVEHSALAAAATSTKQTVL